MGVCYALRESVKLALDIKDSARANAQIDRIIEEQSRAADKLCRRVFHPRLMTQTFDWPSHDSPTPGRLWLGGHSEIATLNAITSGGQSIATSAVKLYPTYGPPYTRVELDQSTSVSFGLGATNQQDIAITAVFAGQAITESTVAALAEDLDTTETQVDVTTVDRCGVGAVLRVGTERMLVTDAAALDTGVNLAANITDQKNATAIPLSTTVNAPRVREVIAIDGERMLVTDVIGTTAYVTRAYDGTVLAAHTSGADIYAYRTLTVERGALGTTATTHTTGDSVLRWMPVAEGLVIAETLNQIEQEKTGYARVIGDGENQREARGAGLADKRRDFRKAYGRRVRMGAV